MIYFQTIALIIPARTTVVMTAEVEEVEGAITTTDMATVTTGATMAGELIPVFL